MGFSFGGLIIKNGKDITDEDILRMLGNKDFNSFENISMEEATSSTFYGVAIARLDNMLMALGRALPYSFSFENDELSEADETLCRLSQTGDALCFLSDSISDTYAWSVYSKDKRIRVKCISNRKILFESGAPTDYDRLKIENDEGIIDLLENFTGYSYPDLVFEKHISLTAYEE